MLAFVSQQDEATMGTFVNLYRHGCCRALFVHTRPTTKSATQQQRKQQHVYMAHSWRQTVRSGRREITVLLLYRIRKGLMLANKINNSTQRFSSSQQH